VETVISPVYDAIIKLAENWSKTLKEGKYPKTMAFNTKICG
jgi:hypothetical protein